MQTSDEEIQKLREHILAEIDLTREMSDTEIRAIVSEKCSIYGKQKFLKLSEQEALEQYLFHSLRKLDVLQELLDDPEITEIMVNGAEHIFYEKRGQLFESDKHFTSKEKLNDVIQQMAGSNNRMVNEASPIVDTRLANGSRVNIVLQPIAIDGSAISIRKFPEQPFVMEDLIRFGAITEEAAEFLKVLVLSGYNIFVSGGTGSGKTTFLNALSQFIPREERIITIEDSAELQLIDKPNLVRLETRNANTEGVLPITIRDLIEELVGEFNDEPEDLNNPEPHIEKINDTTWNIIGNVQLDELEEATGLELSSDDYTTFTGLVFDALGVIPNDGEQNIELELPEMTVHIKHILAHQVDAATIVLKPENKPVAG